MIHSAAAGEGDPIAVTHRRVIGLAVPMMLSHVTTPLLGFVGATVIGRLGDAALLGALALGALVFDFLFWTFGSLRMATAGLTAQATGARDADAVDRTLARALVLALVIGVTIVLLRSPIAAGALALSGASSTVAGPLESYILVRILGAPFALANYAFLGSVLGRGRTDLGLLLQATINLVNVALTLLFVLGLSGGVAGAAYATLASEAAGTALGLLVVTRLGSRFWTLAAADILRRADLLRMLAVNRDVMIRTLALALAFAIFGSVGARSGDVTLAANAVLQNMFMIGAFFLDGFATAAETLCGQALGAGDRRGFHRAARLSLGWCLCFGGAVMLAFLAGGGLFIDTMTTHPEIRAAARDVLVLAALAPLVGAAAFAFDGIFIGATWTAPMRNLALVALAAFVLVLLGSRSLGNAGLWIAFLAFLAIRGIGQGLLFPWLAKRTFAAPGVQAASVRSPAG